MKNTHQVAFTLGKPPCKTLAVREFASSSEITYKMGDLKIEDVLISIDDCSVVIKVRPISHGFVMDSPMSMLYESLEHDKALEAIIEKYADVRWDSGAPEMIFGYFNEYLTYVSGAIKTLPLRSSALLRTLVYSTCYLRDHCGFKLNAKSFRDCLSLNNLGVFESRHGGSLPDTLRQALKKYMSQFRKNGLDWSKESLTTHGYMAMEMAMALSPFDSDEAGRGYRISSADLRHRFTREIKSSRIRFRKDEIVIDVTH